MKERPILFSSPMVRAILAGTKTQTRRIVKLPPNSGTVHVDPGGTIFGPGPYLKVEALNGANAGASIHPRIHCPYGYPDDRLWCRETWRCFGGREYEYQRERDAIIYRATDWGEAGDGDGWRPSIFMPRWASRITLEVTGVRVERVQDISKEDAIAEGARFTDYGMHECQMSIDGGKTYGVHRQQKAGWSLVQTTSYEQCLGTPQAAFGNLWIAINGQESWDANVWVWVVEFRRVEPIDALIDRSSIGAGLRDIKERGIDAHTKDLERELDELPVEFGGNKR